MKSESPPLFLSGGRFPASQPLPVCLSVCVCGGGTRHCHRPREGVTPGRKMGRKLLGNLCLFTRRAGAPGLGLVLSKHGFPQKQPSWLLGCPSLCLCLVEGIFLRQAISHQGGLRLKTAGKVEFLEVLKGGSLPSNPRPLVSPIVSATQPHIWQIKQNKCYAKEASP